MAFIAGDTLEYKWEYSERMAMVKLITNGAMLPDLMEEFKRPLIEILILIDDLHKSGEIPKKYFLKLLR